MKEHPLPQAAQAVLMIRPAGFAFNPETAATNAFQTRTDRSPVTIQQLAVEEFDSLVSALHRVGVEVIVFDDLSEPRTPDAVFPNNWISFHADGTVVLYPMQAPSRRLERRESAIELLKEGAGFRIDRVVDLTHHEAEGRFLEGTGSVVFDHRDRCGYASLSERTHPDIVREVCSILGYEYVLFRATDSRGNPVYHTNVLMSVGTAFAVVAAEAVPDSGERARLVQRLTATGRSVIEISRDQMGRFTGNILEVADRAGSRAIVMSRAARGAFTLEQMRLLTSDAAIVDAPLATIEAVGGGSARCMMAEIFLPRTPKAQRPSR